MSTQPPEPPGATPTPGGPIAVHRAGTAHDLGQTETQYGVWDRRTGGMVGAYPLTQQGWEDAWRRFWTLESTSPAAGPVTTTPASTPVTAQTPPAAGAVEPATEQAAPFSPPVASPAYPAAAYGAPTAGAYPRTNGMAVASLVLGITGFLLLPLIGSILGIVFGFMARSQIRDSRGAESGEGMAVAGIVLGFVAIGLGVLFALLLIPFHHASFGP